MREIILDTETTGLDYRSGDRIIEIGAIEMHSRVPTMKKLQYYINPQREVSQGAYRVHGISSHFLRDKPLFKDIAHSFLEFIAGARLVIHNAPFDVGFLNHELSLINLPSIDVTMVTDTLRIARKMFPGAKNNLDALCKRFKINNTNRFFHGALKDAELLAQVYLHLSSHNQKEFNFHTHTQEEVIEMRFNQIAGGKIIAPTQEEKDARQALMQTLI